jgi:hypothetical protein
MSLEHAFFYKSVNGDRVYDDASFEHWLKKFFTSGVFLNDLQVTANDDMTVTVCAGYVNADGKVKIFESATPLIIETAGASYPRIDSIVLERNDTERDILLKVIKGGYSSEPVAHTPVRQDGVYQLVIAQILVNAGAVKVTQADITDTRSNTELCGIVAGAVEQIDFSQVQTQFDAYFAQYKKQIATDYTQYNADMETYLDQMAEDFATWFETIRNQLDEDAAGHLQNQIDEINEKLEYAGGSIVEVTVDDNEGEYNIEGLEVNLVIDGKTYTETINDNIAKFTGVLEVGTATITCVDAVQEFNGETIIEIPYYGAYETSIKGGTSYKEWIKAGGLNPSSYETLDDLLEDETAIRTLMTKKAAVDILVKMSGDDLATIINHPYIAKWVNYREYAYSTLSAVSEIKTIMDASGMYGMYITVESDGTWQPKGLVPVMTSNTEPYGKAFADSSFDTTAPYQPFSTTGYWHSANGKKNGYIGYKFVVPTKVNKVGLNYNSNKQPTLDIKLQGSNNGSDWDDLVTFVNEDMPIRVPDSDNSYYEIEFDNEMYYMHYRLFSSYGFYIGEDWFGINNLQFYGRQLEALIPPMTSNTAPIGNVTYSSIFSTTYDGWRAFDCGGISTNGYAPANSDKFGSAYVQYEFEKPVMAKVVGGSYKSGDTTCYYKLQASNNGETFDTIVESIEMIGNANMTYYNTVSDKAYKYYRFIYVSNTANDIIKGSGAKFQLYGTPDYESRTYIYEHGVEVMALTKDVNNSGFMPAITREDTIYLQPRTDGSKTNAGTVLTSNSISMEPYSLLCLNMGQDIKFSDGTYGNVCVGNKIDSSTSVTSWAPIAYVRPASNIPNARVDITSVNTSTYCVALATYADYYDIAEWWLE